MNIIRHTSNGKSNFPFIVEVQNTENWNTVSAHASEFEAINKAALVSLKFPNLPVRVHHYTGGPIS